jgi:tetratricopeptide (TPR) repeat protein
MDAAADAMERALAIWQRLGDRAQEAAILTNLGLVAAGSNQLAKATDLLKESLNLYREMGDEVGVVRVEMNLGAIFNQAGEYEAAIDLTSRTLDRLDSMGDASRTALALSNRALAFLEIERINEAVEDLTQAVAVVSGEYSANALHWTVCVLAVAADRTGNDDLAVRLATLHHTIRVESGAAVAGEETRLLSGIPIGEFPDRQEPLEPAEMVDEISGICRDLARRLHRHESR